MSVLSPQGVFQVICFLGLPVRYTPGWVRKECIKLEMNSDTEKYLKNVHTKAVVYHLKQNRFWKKKDGQTSRNA